MQQMKCPWALQLGRDDLGMGFQFQELTYLLEHHASTWSVPFLLSLLIPAYTWLPDEKGIQAFNLIPGSNLLSFLTDSASVACTTIPLVSGIWGVLSRTLCGRN